MKKMVLISTQRVIKKCSVVTVWEFTKAKGQKVKFGGFAIVCVFCRIENIDKGRFDMTLKSTIVLDEIL